MPNFWALPVEIRTEPAFEAVVLPMRGSFAQHDAAIARLREELRSAGVEPAGPVFGRYWNDPAEVPEQELLWEVGCAVPHGARIRPPFELREVPAQMVASMRVHDPYTESGRNWPLLFEWLARNGYYLNGQSMTLWGGATLPGGVYTPETELRIPVGRLRVVPLLFRSLICIWGVCIFALFAAVSVRHRRRLSLWAGHLWVLLGVCCAVLYLQPLLAETMYVYSRYGSRGFTLLTQWSGVVGIVIPPLLAHVFYRVTRGRLPRPWLFRSVVIAMYGVCAALALISRVPWNAQTGDALVAATAAFCLTMVLLGRIPTPEHRVYIALLAAVIAVSLLHSIFAGGAAGEFLETVQRAMPIPFLFATMYYNERAVFFDVVAKRGLFALAMLVVLTAYFAVAPSWLWSVRLGWVGAWVFPLTALPLVMVTPWFYKHLSSHVDRRWLGRNLTPGEAHRFFIACLAGAGTEEGLISAAEKGLAAIFHAQVAVRLGPATETGGCEAPVLARGEPIGVVSVATPAGGRPLLSEDRQLLASLAQSLGLMLDNLRLRDKELRQERREQDLLLLASRAELRSLRAQVNPHFLFNALNSIAALIATEPEHAERTVERLAELFRYALRRPDREWVHLADELTFVKCYLEVEATRFHGRLKAEVHQDDALGRALVPAMMVHTLVENAVKHGIAKVCGEGSIEVRASRSDGVLRIQVLDSGGGFPGGDPGAFIAPGHGLSNVQERLRAHFGEDARLALGRDEKASMTTVSIAMPYLTTPPAEPGEASQ